MRHCWVCENLILTLHMGVLFVCVCLSLSSIHTHITTLSQNGSEVIFSMTWWLLPVIAALKSQRQENHSKFRACVPVLVPHLP